MARLRTVKPEYWTDEAVGQCSMAARLLFIATWNFADDHGGLARSSKQLKAQAFPYDNIDCEPLVQELLQHGLLIEYEAGGKKYLHIKGFDTHQKVEKKGNPRVPLYIKKESTPDKPVVVPDSSPIPLGSSPTSSGSSLGSGVESSGEETSRDDTKRVAFPGMVEREPEAGALAQDLIARNVKVTSIHPTLLGWLKDGITRQRIFEAVDIAARSKQGEAIPANYLDSILRAPQRGPPASRKAMGAFDRLMEANGGE